MPVKIRLARRGRKRRPIYDVVVADSRAPRDGRFIEKLGTFNPNTEPPIIVLDEERALHWVMTGAKPSETARTLLSRMGIMLRKHLQVGVNKGAITQEVADSRFEDWKASKDWTNLISKGNDNEAVIQAGTSARKAEPEVPVATETPEPEVEVTEAPTEETEAPVAETPAAPEVEETPVEEAASEEPTPEAVEEAPVVAEETPAPVEEETKEEETPTSEASTEEETPEEEEKKDKE